METHERRNIRQRAALLQRLVNDVVRNPSVTLTVETLQTWLNVPAEAAERILRRLTASGLFRAVDNGMWVRAAWLNTQFPLVLNPA
jgi:Fic family protein